MIKNLGINKQIEKKFFSRYLKVSIEASFIENPISQDIPGNFLKKFSQKTVFRENTEMKNFVQL
jgi:hypothetical protein